MERQSLEVTGTQTIVEEECLLCRVTYSIFSNFPPMPSAMALNVETGAFFPQDRLRSMPNGFEMADAQGYGWACNCRGRSRKRFDEQFTRRDHNGRAQQPVNTDIASPQYGNSPRVPQSFSNARPFQYTPDAIGDNVQDIAARGVSDAHEAECFARYEHDMMACDMIGATYKDSRTYLLCKQRAFSNYQTCRGF
ncbi:hypothetical protein [Paraburkholderia susongensis]|uniref:Uncharacterized protein n=1 Tax=Paraburkholderia susongensis TaxID=1515439 RepID=A0A1X7JIZ1_9BURK|nr:hypothetical protein SAMN06265784_102687 [Paraburkholderia susongensis]